MVLSISNDRLSLLYCSFIIKNELSHLNYTLYINDQQKKCHCFYMKLQDLPAQLYGV